MATFVMFGKYSESALKAISAARTKKANSRSLPKLMWSYST